MIINFSKLSAAELTEVSQDLAKIMTKKKKPGAAYNFWHELIRGIIQELDTRISAEEDATRQQEG